MRLVNLFKRFFCIMFALFILILFLPIKSVFAQTPTITVFSWEDYIDLGDDEAGISSILDDYTRERGIEVKYITFANSEEMYNELLKNPNACDLLCPSEYMIMKMMTEDLIRPFTTPQSYKTYCSSYIKDVFKNLKVSTTSGEVPIYSFDEQTTYAVGYMWGTMGFIYNADCDISPDDLNHWDSITSEKYKNKVTIKDSVRDTFIMAVGAVYKDELMQLDTSAPDYNEKLTEIFNRADDETISKVETFLQGLRQNLYGFEVDGGKNDILTGKITVNFAWSGDAAFAIGEGIDAGVNLGYVVPLEGSNVWFDGFVMPKSVSSEQEALCVDFLDYICEPTSAVRNMDDIGYTSVIAGDDVFDYVMDSYNDDAGEISVDLKYFFDPSDTEGNYIVKTNEANGKLFAQYSNEETIKKCAVMANFDPDTLVKINGMWNRIKLITLSNEAIIVIVCIIAIICVLLVVSKHQSKFFIKDFSKYKQKPRRKNCKVIKIEEIR